MTRRRPASMPRPSSTLAAWLAFALLAVGLLGSLGCGARMREDRIINRYRLDVFLVSERKLFGAGIDRGYAHPSDISVERLRVILGSLEIERRERAKTVRQPAIPAEILVEVASALAEAFREADSSEYISVMAQRKQMQKIVFDRKTLTSFVAWMEGDDLIFHLSRSDWPFEDKPRNSVPQAQRSSLPKPHPNDPQQPFRVVTNEFVRPSGETGVAIAWQSDVFGSFAKAAAARTAPVAASGAGAAGAATDAPAAATSTVGTTTVLMGSDDEELPEPEPLTSEQLGALSAEQLRSLADLEEARSAGRVTEMDYRRQRHAILSAAGAN